MLRRRQKRVVPVLSPLRYVIEPTGRFRNEMEKESGGAERLVSCCNGRPKAWTIGSHHRLLSPLL